MRELRLGLAALTAALLLIVAPAAFAAPGDLDTTFGAGGIATADFGRGPSAATDVAVQSDGKVVAVGPSEGRMALTRYNTDGSLDSTFSGDGRALGPDLEDADSFHTPTLEVAIAAGGNIVVAAPGQVTRFNEDGTPDAGFGTDGRVPLAISDDAIGLTLQTDGKILLLGGDGDDNQVARLDTDGSLDDSFSDDGVADISIDGDRPTLRALAVAPGGKIVAVGSVLTSADGTNELVRLNADGSPDSSFSSDGYQAYQSAQSPSDKETSVTAQPDGKILTGGSNGIRRFAADGTPETGFASDGVADANGPIQVLAVDASGLIYAAGSTGGPSLAAVVRRYTAAGQPDTTFSGDGAQTISFDAGGTQVTGLALAPGGKTVAVGPGSSVAASNFGVARLTAGGDLDSAFAADGVQSTTFPGVFAADAVAVGTGGKLVVAGSDLTDVAVARFDPDGSLDTSFSGDGLARLTIPYTDSAYDVLVQPDGKILIAAGNTLGLSATIIRLNADGSLDNGFGSGGYETFINHYRATGLALQPDGKILVSTGAYLTVLRLKPDGTLDTSFGSNGAASAFESSVSTAAAVALRGDGDIAATGSGSGGVDTAVFTSTGALDTAFSGDGLDTAGAGAGEPDAIAFQTDGKLVVGVNESGEGFGALRYASDGTLDTTFSGDGFQFAPAGQGCCLRLGADGTLVLGGSSLVRLLPNGAFDGRFSGDGIAPTASPVRALALTDGGTGIITVGGQVSGDGEVFAVARYEGGPALPNDTQAPAITVTTPSEGQHVTQGASVTPVFSCDDGSGSGVATCSGPAKLDTSAVGNHTFTVTTADYAGNSATKTVSYVVDSPPLDFVPTVTPTPTATASPSPTPSGPTVAQISATLKQHIAPSGKKARIGALVRKGAYALPFVAPAPGTVVVTWSVKAKTIASGKATFKKAGTGRVNVKLTKAGKRALKKAKRLKVTGRVSYTTTAGMKSSATKGFTLRR